MRHVLASNPRVWDVARRNVKLGNVLLFSSLLVRERVCFPHRSDFHTFALTYFSHRWDLTFVFPPQSRHFRVISSSKSCL